MKSMVYFKMLRFMVSLFILSVVTEVYAQTPYIEYSTFLGGSSSDAGHGIAVDSSGCVFIAGITHSSNFPTTEGAYRRTNANGDVYVTKLNREGNALLFSTLVGASNLEYPFGISIDKTGASYVIGETYSTDFPVTSRMLTGSSGYFYFKMNATGSALSYSSKGVEISSVLPDDAGHVYVLGTASNGTLPFTKRAYDTTYNGGNDLFVAKINVAKDSLVFLTFIGGSGNDGGSSMAFDSQKNLIITGSTQSTDFPVKGTPFMQYGAAESGFFVLKLLSDGSDIFFSHRMKVSGPVATDAKDQIYIAATTTVNNLPVTTSSFDASSNGGNDIYLMKLNSDGSQLLYSTYLGGANNDRIGGFGVDQNERVHLAGSTRSSNFPVGGGAYDSTYNGCAACGDWEFGDVFFSVLDSKGGSLVYSTYLGTSSNDELYGMVVDPSGNAYLVGSAYNSSFPTTAGAYRRTYVGGSEAFIIKLVVPLTFGSTGLVDLHQQELNILPNPADGIVQLSFGSNAVEEAFTEVYNLQGNRIVAQTNRNTDHTTIDLAGQPKGLYLAGVTTADCKYFGKIILE
jgi:hypothetical protein